MKKSNKETKKITLRASGASTWVNCPGSVKMKSGAHPYKSNDAAVFGNAVHSAAASILTGKPINLTVQEELQKAERESDFKMYLDFYLNAVENFAIPGKRIVEQRNSVEFEKHIIAGTCDFAVIDEQKDVIYVQIIDLKTGFVPVDVNANLQLFSYAHLILDKIKIKKRPVVITGIIVQPAHNTVKFADIEYNPEKFATLYDVKSKTLNTGVWCKYCQKADICPELKKQIIEYYKPEYQGISLDRVDLIAEILPMAGTIENVMKRIQEDAKQILADGNTIPGFKLAQKSGRRIWMSSISADMLAKKTGKRKKDIVEEKIKSPADLEKTLKIDTSPFTFRPTVNYLAQEEKEASGEF